MHETARRLGVERKTVQSWRQRWNEARSDSVEGRLSDLLRPGTPAKYTPEQVYAIVAISYERPEDSGRLITIHWTQQELVDEAVRRGINRVDFTTCCGALLKRGQPATPSGAQLVGGKARLAFRGEKPRYL